MWLCRCIHTCKGNYNNYWCRNDDAAKRLDERNKGVIFKNWAPLTKCISRINNTDIDKAQDIDIVMPMHNLIEYSDNYSKTSENINPRVSKTSNGRTIVLSKCAICDSIKSRFIKN